MYNSQYYSCEQIDQRLLQGYLDDYNSQTGQSLTKEQFLTKLGNIFAKETLIDNTAVNIGYFVCDTAAGTAAKVLTVAGYELLLGGSFKVKFINRNTAGSATLNINSKGAKALYYGGKPVSAFNSWDNNEVVEIYYDGINYYANNVESNLKMFPMESTSSNYISPNILYRWGAITELEIISFQEAQEGCVNEYMLEFTVSGDNFTLTLPEGIRWIEEPTWYDGYTYQVSIINNLAVYAGWEAQEV